MINKGTVRMIIIAAALIAVLTWAGCKKKSSPTTPDGSVITLSGVITMGGSPQAGVNVYLSWNASQNKATGADGKFSFADLTKGNYIITPSRVRTAFSPSNFEVGSATRSDLNCSAAAASYGSEIGSIMADFSAKDQNGNSFSLYSHFGKVVLIDFTADWCPDCRTKAESAEQFYQKYKDKGFIYILILIDGSPSGWAKEYSLTFPVLDDNSWAIYNIHRKSSIPLPHVLDRNMTIRYKKEGWIKTEVEELIAKLQ